MYILETHFLYLEKSDWHGGLKVGWQCNGPGRIRRDFRIKFAQDQRDSIGEVVAR